MAIDLGQHYRDARLRFMALVNDDNGTTPVPATPLWDIHDVLAHVAGAMEDVKNGNMDGVTTDPWTAAQVERGKTKTVTQLLAQWEEDAPPTEAFLSTPDGATAYLAVVDLHTHLADISTALGVPVSIPDELLSWICPKLLESFQDKVAKDGLPPVEVSAPNIEIFRGRLGRRTEDEVRAYDWSADPTPYLDSWFIFGRAQASIGEVVA